MTKFSVWTRPRTWVRTAFTWLILVALHANAAWWIAWAVVWLFTPKVKVWFEAEGRVTWWQD